VKDKIIHRLVKCTEDGLIFYEIQEKRWFGWDTILRQYDYNNAVNLIKELNHTPIVIREVISIE
jgi:hypothetical protein